MATVVSEKVLWNMTLMTALLLLEYCDQVGLILLDCQQEFRFVLMGKALLNTLINTRLSGISMIWKEVRNEY